MLAGKTGKTLQASPFIESFSVGEISISQSELRLGNIALVGTGLIDRVKIKSATYGLVDDKLFVDGEYFGVGFDFHGGTLSNPGLPWLKDDNTVIKLIGTKNEFDFDDPAPAPKPKKK